VRKLKRAAYPVLLIDGYGLPARLRRDLDA
jgi:hypothetical protein